MKATDLPQNLVSYSNEAIVEGYCHKFNVQRDEAKNLFQETVQFLWKSSKSKETSVPTLRVDEMWHVFILHTKEYEQFCLEKLGKFVHHYPRIKENSCDTAGPPSNTTQSACDAAGPEEIIRGACDAGGRPKAT